MEISALFQKFHTGLIWNAVVYATEKISYLIVIYTLFLVLDDTLFSTWANANSLVYLALLWADLGMRKAIPLFAPQALQHPTTISQFIRKVATLHAGALGCTAVLFYYFFHSFCAVLSLKHHALLLIGTVALFIAEGLVSVTRLMFHAHFLHRPFNTINTLVILAETVINMSIIALLPKTITLVVALLFSRAFIAFVTVLISWRYAYKNHAVKNHAVYKNDAYTDTNTQHYQGNQEQERKPDVRQQSLRYPFMHHALAMWVAMVLKSLSERNFLLPLFTGIFGPQVANIYKIANDGALLFQRTIIKTIGTTDTVLLAHAHATNDSVMIRTTFDHLRKTIYLLIIPIVFVSIPFIWMKRALLVHDPAIALLFVLLMGTYLIESIFSPYERLLEIKQDYRSLYVAQIPYFGVLAGVGIYALLIFSGVTLSGSGSGSWIHATIVPKFSLFPKLSNSFFVLILVAVIQVARLINTYLNMKFATRNHGDTVTTKTTNKITATIKNTSTVMHKILYH